MLDLIARDEPVAHQGMPFTMDGPRAVAMPNGKRFQASTSRRYFGFPAATSGSDVPDAVTYSQLSATGCAPHCSLNLYVPSWGVDRPKSRRASPRSTDDSMMLQYKR